MIQAIRTRAMNSLPVPHANNASVTRSMPSTEGAGKYPMRIRWSTYFVVYDHSLMTDEKLTATPLAETEGVTLLRLAASLDDDFKRIETYLKCLAFDPGVPAGPE